MGIVLVGGLKVVIMFFFNETVKGNGDIGNDGVNYNCDRRNNNDIDISGVHNF